MKYKEIIIDCRTLYCCDSPMRYSIRTSRYKCEECNFVIDRKNVFLLVEIYMFAKIKINVIGYYEK